MFTTYLTLGFDHILDLQAYDHILFLLALCGIFTIKEFKTVLILVTAFTIGHCITLGLATYNVLNVSSYIVEILIPVTIIITAVSNLYYTDTKAMSLTQRYLIPLFFGLIHGLGFSFLLKAMLSESESIIASLLPFNIGVELGQIVIISIILLISYIVINILKIQRKYWNYSISLAAILFSTKMILERI